MQHFRINMQFYYFEFQTGRGYSRLNVLAVSFQLSLEIDGSRHWRQTGIQNALLAM